MNILVNAGSDESGKVWNDVFFFWINECGNWNDVS